MIVPCAKLTEDLICFEHERLGCRAPIPGVLLLTAARGEAEAATAG
jgi:hypothetical protein